MAGCERRGNLIIGPAGSGKSTFCELMHKHCETQGRRMHVINLDPAAEEFSYPVSADIRDLISLEDVMAEMKLGPNGGLIYCMEYLVENMEWLEDAIEEAGADAYVLFDCPGQIELYSHQEVIRQLISQLQHAGFRLAATYLLDAQFVADAGKFVSGVLCCLSAMTALELPHLNILSKCDLLPSRKHLDKFLEADTGSLCDMLRKGTHPGLFKLNAAFCDLVEEWNMVQFLPCDPRDPDTIELILGQVDNALQYHDDVEPKIREEGEAEDGDLGGGDPFDVLRSSGGRGWENSGGGGDD